MENTKNFLILDLSILLETVNDCDPKLNSN